MTAKRILILLLMWLIPLYPVLASVAVHQPAPMQATQMSQSISDHDCCNPPQAGDHSLKVGGGCDTGRCISHCAISLMNTSAAISVQVAVTHARPNIAPLSSITLEMPLRPPSLL